MKLDAQHTGHTVTNPWPFNP